MNIERAYAYGYLDIEASRKGILKLIACGTLHREALNVFCFLADFSLHKETGRCFPSYGAIAEGVGLSVKTVEKVMQQLQRLGVLLRRRIGFTRQFMVSFLSPDQRLEFEPRTTPQRSSPSTPEESSPTTPQRSSSINIEDSTKGFEQRVIGNHARSQSPAARASHYSDPTGPHESSTPVGDVDNLQDSGEMSLAKARGIIKSMVPLGSRIPLNLENHAANLVARGDISLPEARVFIESMVGGLRHG